MLHTSKQPGEDS